MRRVIPIAPAAREAALDRALDQLSAPAVPADLIARIVREVPLLPQAAAPQAVATGVTARPVAAQVAASVPSQRPRYPVWRRLAAGGGIGALAAGIAAVAMIGMGADPQGIPASGGGAPMAFAPAVPDTADGKPPALAAPRTKLAAAATPSRPVTAQTAMPEEEAIPVEASPAVPVEMTPEVLASAAAAPKGELIGPRDDDDEKTGPQIPSRGLMGPPAPQAYGYVGALSPPGGGSAAVPGAPAQENSALPPGRGPGGRLPGGAGGGHPF